jgi:hypothetical protein
MDNIEFKSSKSLVDAYENGLEGSKFDPKHYEQFCGSLKYQSFGAGAPFLAGSGKGKLSTPYKSVLKFFPKAFGDDRQVGPDCVSHSAPNAGDISRCVEIDLRGEAEEFVARGATELVYGMRGHCGWGMSCSRAAEIVTKIGYAIRKKYGSIDLSTYNYKLGNSWCPRNAPQELLDLVKTNLFATTTLIKTVEEARDALANGYGISICSGQGFSAVRDEKGFAKANKRWSHAMCLGACDDRLGAMDFLVINSWGKWNSGGHPDFGPIPDGSFMVKAETIQKMMNGGGTFVYSNFDGFPAQKLPDYGIGEFL